MGITTEEASMAPKRGYTASKEQLVGRLARVEGQIRGVARMVEEDRYCIDVLTQISACRAALEQISLGLLDEHARHCMLGDGEAPEDPGEQVQELMGAVGRLVKS
jgi:CsoR family transcriptional regulator, copper-sensing transcriptional repressor